MTNATLGGFLSESQRQQLNQFPETLNQEDLIQYFLLADCDLEVIPVRSPAYSRFGFALSLCALRFLGFIPEALKSAPESAMSFVLRQLNLNEVPGDFNQYGSRAQTKSDHALRIEQHLGFRHLRNRDQEALKKWLLAQAMEHDRPTLLLKVTIEKLKRDKIVRPTLASLERLVGSVRDQARKKTYQLLASLLSEERKFALDNMLVIDEKRGKTLLTWLRQRAVSHSPESILLTLEKIVFLEQEGVHKWDLSALNSNRLKFLNRQGKHSTNQALQRSLPENRYPILIAFMHQALEELIDEVVDLFDQALSQSYSRAKNSLKKHHEKMQENTNEKVRLLKVIGSVILDNNIADPELRRTLYGKVSLDKLRLAIDECDSLIRPENDKCLDYFVKRFNYLRQFTQQFLKQLRFKSLQDNHPILQAIELLKEMNQSASKKVPDNVPTSFINDVWKRYVFQDGKIDRKYYELCTLWELRNILRSGDIWVDGGWRYNNPEHYLIPRTQWSDIKDEVCNLLQISQCAKHRLTKRQQEIEKLFIQLNVQITQDENIKIVKDQLVISPLEAESEKNSLKELRQLINSRLPKIDLPDILVEVDSWLGFSECFYHAGNQNPNPGEFPVYLYAALLSEATNLGPTALADVADLSYDRIVWYKNWYIREETLEAAKTKLVNFQHEQVLSQHFGKGTFSSSDGRRVPVAVKTKIARAFVKYFGYERGLNLYSWTSDQFSQYGCKVTSPTMREATFVLDAILDNETELKIERHTTDTAGYTEIIFALFDLLGLRFEPRIKNIGDQRIYYIGQRPHCPNVDRLITGSVNTKLIEESWDDMLRLAASLKKGWVSASLFISKLQALPRKSNLSKALQEYGKIPKTVSILRSAISEQHRKEISVQLNKGEAVHDLQQFLHLGREGRIYARQPNEQETHFGCLNLLINMVIIWNTVYMAEVLEQLKQEGLEINEEDLKHISPARREHINPYGKYQFDLSNPLKGRLRPLREGD